MKLLNYEKEIVKRHLVELDDPVNGEKKWIRVSRNGALDHWKLLSKRDTPYVNLNGEVSDEIEKDLELRFRGTRYG